MMSINYLTIYRSESTNNLIFFLGPKKTKLIFNIYLSKMKWNVIIEVTVPYRKHSPNFRQIFLTPRAQELIVTVTNSSTENWGDS